MVICVAFTHAIKWLKLWREIPREPLGSNGLMCSFFSHTAINHWEDPQWLILKNQKVTDLMSPFSSALQFYLLQTQKGFFFFHWEVINLVIGWWEINEWNMGYSQLNLPVSCSGCLPLVLVKFLNHLTPNAYPSYKIVFFSLQNNPNVFFSHRLLHKYLSLHLFCVF